MHAVVQDSENKILYEGNKTANGGVHITKTSALLGLAEYKSAVLVGKAKNNSGKDNKNGVCEAEARVRAFMRMLRIGEGTSGEKGYTKAFNRNIITDLSTHPQKNYGGSSAAGAYQIMRYTWWWLNGEKLKQLEDKSYEKVGIYEEYHDYVKKYKISDYSPKSQDLLCIIIMESSQKGLLQLIIDNKIEKAIRNKACLIWASLPEVGDESHYFYKGKRQSAEKMADCLMRYEDFLKEELANKTDLHLEKGFLKIFDYNCCDSNSLSTGCGGKTNVDLTTKLTFAAQTTGSNCTESCKKIVRQLDVEPEGATENSKVVKGLRESYYQLADENSEKTELVFHSDEIKSGMKYLDNSLDAGYAVVIGVNHTLKYRKHGIINEDTTDHYVVIVGRECENNQLYYQFWDVGSRHGDNKEYRFKLTPENHLISEKNYRSDGKKYTVTQIRRNIKNNKIVP